MNMKIFWHANYRTHFFPSPHGIMANNNRPSCCQNRPESSLLSVSTRPGTALAQPGHRARRGGHGRAAMLGSIGALFLAAGSVWAEQYSFSMVALSGQPAPGTGPGVNYSIFYESPSLNIAGQVTFPAFTTASASNLGLWSGGTRRRCITGAPGQPCAGYASGS